MSDKAKETVKLAVVVFFLCLTIAAALYSLSLYCGSCATIRTDEGQYQYIPSPDVDTSKIVYNEEKDTVTLPLYLWTTFIKYIQDTQDLQEEIQTNQKLEGGTK